MSPSSPPTDQEVLSFLAQFRRPVSAREIAEGLTLRHSGRRALPKILSRLKKKGLLRESDQGRYQFRGDAAPTQKAAKPSVPQAPADLTPKAAARDPNLITGRLVAHRDGYGFVVPETPRKDFEGDLFIPPDQIGDAMHGDRVIARIERRNSQHRGGFARAVGAGRAEGRIVRVLGRAHPAVVGLFRHGPRGNIVLPYEARITQAIVIPPGEELTPEFQAKFAAQQGRNAACPSARELDGMVVNVELTRFPRGGVAPAGRVVEVLGKPGEFGVDVEILIRKHHLPHTFSDAVLEEAQRAAQPVSDAEGRRAA